MIVTWLGRFKKGFVIGSLQYGIPKIGWNPIQQTRDIEPMLVQCLVFAAGYIWYTMYIPYCKVLRFGVHNWWSPLVLFIVIFTFIIHVSKTPWLSQSIAIYLVLSVYNSQVLTIPLKHTVLFLYWAVLGANRPEPIPVLPSQKHSVCRGNPVILEQSIKIVCLLH